MKIYTLYDHIRGKTKLTYRRLKFDDEIHGNFWYAKYTHDTWEMKTRENMDGITYHKYRKYTPIFQMVDKTSKQSFIVEGVGELLRCMIKVELSTFYKLANGQ